MRPIRLWACLALAVGCWLSVQSPSVKAQSPVAPVAPDTANAPNTRPAAQAPVAPIKSEVPSIRPSAATGLELYAEHCIRCHGPFGRGDGELIGELPSPPRSFAAPATVRGMSPAEAFEVITNGKIEQLMPPWRDALTEAERWDVLYGSWSFYFTPTRMARAEAAWTASCAGCHSQDGKGVEAAPLARPEWLALQSGSDLFDITLGAPAHADLELDADREALWLAVDFVRALVFEPLSHDHISAGGRIEGRVVNGTAGADPESVIAEQVVVQAAPLGVELPGEIISATISADGSYGLDVVMATDVVHRVSALYKGVEYVTDELPTGAAAESSEVEVTVFETSSDVAITVAALHAVLAPSPARGMFEVVERWSLVNSDDRARVSSGDDDPTAILGLLAGATDVQVHGGAPQGSMRSEGETMYDLRPIPPGGREVVLIYDVPYSSTEIDTTRELALPLDVHTLTVADENASIESDWALGRERVELMGLDVEQVVGGPFAVGESAQARVAGVAAPGADVTRNAAVAGSTPLRVVSQRSIARFGLVGLALAVLVAGSYPFFERRRSPAARVRAVVRQQDRVLEALLELERRNSAGEIAPRDFAHRRAELIGKGIAIEQRLDELRKESGVTDSASARGANR